MDRPIEYAQPYRIDGDALHGALDLLDSWCREPTW
jgi:hypothetical protein